MEQSIPANEPTYRLIKVLVPTSTFSKHFLVPEYEVPIIQSLWGPHVKPGSEIQMMSVAGNRPGPDPEQFVEVEVEYQRLRELYRHPEGQPAIDGVYGSPMSFGDHLRQRLQHGPGTMDRLIAGEDPASVLGQTAARKDSDGGDGDSGGDDAADDLEAIGALLPGKFRQGMTDSLRAASLTDAEDILDTDDETLLALSWVTENTLELLREAAATAMAQRLEQPPAE